MQTKPTLKNNDHKQLFCVIKWRLIWVEFLKIKCSFGLALWTSAWRYQADLTRNYAISFWSILKSQNTYCRSYGGYRVLTAYWNCFWGHRYPTHVIYSFWPFTKWQFIRNLDCVNSRWITGNDFTASKSRFPYDTRATPPCLDHV